MIPYWISLGVVIAVFVAAVILLEIGHKRTVAAYEGIIDKRDAEYETLADRLFVKERLPPSRVDLAAVHEQRVEDERERGSERRNRTVALGTGPVDKAQNRMIEAHLRKRQPAQESASTVLESQISLKRDNSGAIA